MQQLPLSFLLSLLLASLSLVLADVVCLNDWDCSLGGTCNQTTATCDCDIWWTGPTCAQLNLQPAHRTNGLNLAVNTTTWSALPTDEATHTWCTSIHYDNSSNDYFAAVSYITNHCTLDDWTTNSQVVTVRSESPYGPFDPESMEVIVPAFAHNPKVVRYVDGMWLLFFIGSVGGTIAPITVPLPPQPPPLLPPPLPRSLTSPPSTPIPTSELRQSTPATTDRVSHGQSRLMAPGHCTTAARHCSAPTAACGTAK